MGCASSTPAADAAQTRPPRAAQAPAAAPEAVVRAAESLSPAALASTTSVQLRFTFYNVPQEMPPLYNDPPLYANGLGRVSKEHMKKEKHGKMFRDHQDAMQTHNGIREAREDLLATVGVGVGVLACWCWV